MSRSVTVPGSFRLWPIAGFLAAVVCGLLIAELLMAPPRSELYDLGVYFVVSGIVTLAAGRLLVLLLDRRLAISVQQRSLLVAVIGPAVALANVLIIAQLMFVSTGHDLRLLIAVIAFSGLLAAVVASWSARITTRRVDRVHAALRQLERGEPQSSESRKLPDEIDGLAARVSTLAAKLEAADRAREEMDRERRDLTAAISHDLRTPLASVRAMIEALCDDVMPRGDVRRYHEAIGRDVERLSGMVDDLLELAQIDAGAMALSRQPLALDRVAADVVAAMQIQADIAGVSLTIRTAGTIPPAPVDGARIERALGNLIRNALDHTPAGGSVTVVVEGSPGSVAVQVIDTGPGIDAADQAHIWDRFYRGDPSRSRVAGSLGGTGMGLAIVRGFVEAHGGTVGVSSSRGSGSVFTMRLPSS